MNKQEFRRSILAVYGASDEEATELLAYNQSIADCGGRSERYAVTQLPEPHVATWEEYAALAEASSAFETLKQRLVQFKFPIQAGISQTEAYRHATRKGFSADEMPAATGLVLQQPEQLQLQLYQSLAGAIPILIAGNREDFVTLVRALTLRNEPQPVPLSMGACIVSGFNNWDRIHQYRQHWEAKNYDPTARWIDEFQRILPQKELYQDRFIILSRSFYSNIQAQEIRISKSEWQNLSLIIRLEHECTHYFTRRFFNSMRNNILDELIADYRGIVAAIGHYRADWFLRFIGLESFPQYREGGRLQNYLGQPPLCAGAVRILQALIKDAAENLQHFDTDYANKLKTLRGQTLVLISLCSLTLEELASPEASDRIQQTLTATSYQ